MKLMNKKLYQYSIIILGFILIIVLIWFRFIRQRLPKDIPFHLTEYGCIILIYICCIYLFILMLLITEFKTKNDKLNLLMEYIYKPLKVLDESIKMHPQINYYYYKAIDYCITINSKIYYTYIYCSFNILPRVILVTVLSIDIFYFIKIAYLYKIILLGILPLLYKYMIYNFKYAKEQYILKLESITEKIMTDYNEDPNDTSWSFLDVRDFIDIQTASIFYHDHKYRSNPIPTTDYFKKVRHITEIEQKQAEHYRLSAIIIPISLHLEEFDLRHNYNNKIKYIKISLANRK